MKLNVNKFCALATSAAWQSWLYNYNADIYKKFIRQLHESRGCSQNREIMQELLQLFRDNKWSDDLYKFISLNYPDMIMRENNQKYEVDEIFGYYNPNLLTYPRRIILYGENLQQEIDDFIKDKLVSDSLILNGKGYVEYMLVKDKYIIDSVPTQNWKIRAYKDGKEKKTS